MSGSSRRRSRVVAVPLDVGLLVVVVVVPLLDVLPEDAFPLRR